MEAELKQVYEGYLERFRNLHYLEVELEKVKRAELQSRVQSMNNLKQWRAQYVTCCNMY